ncbi:hypothetical protein ACFOGG_14975 [Brenneria rubrifaciens]
MSMSMSIVHDSILMVVILTIYCQPLQKISTDCTFSHRTVQNYRFRL